MPNVRHWCATFYKEPSCSADLRSGNLRYLIAGEEICPKTGRTHWQCYMEFKNPISMKKIKELFDDKTVHLEHRMGTKDEARNYCMKDGKYTEYGIWCPGPGFRTDLVEVVETMKKKRLSEIMVEQPDLYCKYRNGLRDIQASLDVLSTKEFRQVEVEVISGPTGCGKTRRAMANATFKIEGNELNWWDGYDMNESIVIDEYDNDVKITRLLNLLDGYQLRLPIKGGFTYANWNKVYITTNLKKHELHAQAKPAHRAALFRRITAWTDLWEQGAAGNTILQHLSNSLD